MVYGPNLHSMLVWGIARARYTLPPFFDYELDTLVSCLCI